MVMRKFQCLWVLLLAGLASCGDVEDDGRGGVPLQIVFTDPIANTASFDIDFTLTSPDGFLLADGSLTEGLTVISGVPHSIGDAFFAKPGDSLRITMTAWFNGGSVSVGDLHHLFREGDAGLELGVNYFELEDAYLISLKPLPQSP